MSKNSCEYNPAALRAIVKAKGLTQYALSHRSHVKQGTIATLLAGRRTSAEEETLKKVTVDGLDVPIEAVLARPMLVPGGCVECPTCDGRGYLAEAAAA